MRIISYKNSCNINFEYFSLYCTKYEDDENEEQPIRYVLRAYSIFNSTSCAIYESNNINDVNNMIQDIEDAYEEGVKSFYIDMRDDLK